MMHWITVSTGIARLTRALTGGLMHLNVTHALKIREHLLKECLVHIQGRSQLAQGACLAQRKTAEQILKKSAIHERHLTKTTMPGGK